MKTAKLKLIHALLWALFPLAIAAPSLAVAQTPEASAPDSAAGAPAMSEGEIRKIDNEAGKITLKHGPLANLDMPGMTMIFKVKDPSMLAKLSPGAKVRFVAEKVDGSIVITQIEPAAMN